MGSESVGNNGMSVNRSAPSHRDAGDELDLPGIAGAIGRRKGLIAAVTIASFLGALAFVFVVKPIYTGESRVLIENQESYFTRPDTGSAAALAPDSEAVASQVPVITSRDLARQAIRELGLKGNPEFDPLAGGQGFVSRILITLGLKASLSKLAPEDRILENYTKRVSVFAVPKSRVVNIQFSARDPKLAARGANKIAGLYIGLQQKAKKQQAKLAAVSLGSLIGDLRSKLAMAESKVEAFRAKSGLMMGANNALVPSQQLAEINTQLAEARTSMADTQAKARLIRRMIRSGKLNEVTDVASNQSVRRLAGQRSTLRSRIAREARSLGPAHPRMKELRAQLASVNTELRSTALKTARGLENNAQIAKVRVENLKAAISNQQQRVGATSVDQVKLRELELEAKLTRGQLESNLNKYREALARQHSVSTPGDARVISRAFEPTRPSFPKKLPLLIFATFAGFILSLGWVLASELLSGRAFVAAQPVPMPAQEVFAEPQVEPSFTANMNVADIPASPAVPVGFPVVVSAPQEDPPEPVGIPLGAAQQKLVTRIKGLDTVAYGCRILVCAENESADHAAGIEPVARTLASEKQVILVDLSGRLETAGAGLSDLLDGHSSFAEVIERDPGSRLHIIARGWGEPEIGPDLDNVLDALSQTYDLVFVVVPEDETGTLMMDLAPASDLALIAAATSVSGDKAVELRRALLDHGASSVQIWAAPRQQEADNDEAAAPEGAAAA